jgi:hypothetical protein
MAHVATVTIDSDQVPADATNFPAYINLAHLFAGSESFASTVANGGGDIRVFQGASELAREVVSCRPGTFFDFSGSSLPTGFSNTTDTWLAASDYIRPGGSTGRNIFADFGAADGTAIGIVNNTTALAGHYGGLLFRQYDADNYWVTDIDFNAGSLRLYKRVAGSATVVDTASVSVSLNTEHEVKVLFSGNDITVYLDGVAKITATDSFNASATTHGLRGNQTGLRFYEFHFIAEQETTGTGELHVLIPFLDSSQDTVLSIYADGSSADYAVDDTFGRNAVWGDYALVMHLGEADGSLSDSTGGGGPYSVTSTGNGTGTAQQTGKMGLGYDFSGGQIVTDTPATGTAAFTMSAWGAFSGARGNEQTIVASWSNPQHVLFRLNPDLTLEGFVDDGSQKGGTFAGSATADTLTHTVMRLDSGTLSGAFNASWSATTFTGIGTLNTGSNDYRIGGRAADPNEFMDGVLDEVRVRHTALSANWITTEYNNQSDPSSFYTATDPNASPPGGDPPSVVPYGLQSLSYTFQPIAAARLNGVLQ